MMGIWPRGLFTSLHSPALSTWGACCEWKMEMCDVRECAFARVNDARVRN